MDQDQVHDSYEPQHGDTVLQGELPGMDDKCPMCQTDAMDGWLRICGICEELGCPRCVADQCERCTQGRFTCHSCHERKAWSILRGVQERLALQQDDQAPVAESLVLRSRICSVEAEWDHLTVLLVPFGRTTLPRTAFGSRIEIMSKLREEGFEAGEDPIFLWGNSLRPDVDKAIKGYILVVPDMSLANGKIPVVCQTLYGERVRCLPATQTGERWRLDFLSADERRDGYQLKNGEASLCGPERVTLRPGDVLVKTPPWRIQNLILRTGSEMDPQLDHPRRPSPFPARARGSSSGLRGGGVQVCTAISGVVLLDGKLHVKEPPLPGQTWKQWLADMELPYASDVWATCDGRQVDDSLPLAGEPILLRLHYRLRGGAKASKPDGLVKKLASHLESKGVPASEAVARAESVLETVGHSVVAKAYDSLDPWKALKAATNGRLRLVKVEEARHYKEKASSKVDKQGIDPWTVEDPWSMARKDGLPTKDKELVELALVPVSSSQAR